MPDDAQLSLMLVGEKKHSRISTVIANMTPVKKEKTPPRV